MGLNILLRICLLLEDTPPCESCVLCVCEKEKLHTISNPTFYTLFIIRQQPCILGGEKKQKIPAKMKSLSLIIPLLTLTLGGGTGIDNSDDVMSAVEVISTAPY